MPRSSCRYLYYLGRIRAVQLEYTDAKDCLQQAARRAPSGAHGFRITVQKWLVTVRMLLGETPERTGEEGWGWGVGGWIDGVVIVCIDALLTVGIASHWAGKRLALAMGVGMAPPTHPPMYLPPAEFTAPAMRAALLPYFEVTQAVRMGDLVAFK